MASDNVAVVKSHIRILTDIALQANRLEGAYKLWFLEGDPVKKTISFATLMQAHLDQQELLEKLTSSTMEVIKSDHA